MSTHQSSEELQAGQKPRYFTARAGASLAGVAPHTVRKRIEPDAYLLAEKGDKTYGVYTEVTLRAFAAELREAQGRAS
jgi:hypothetical protein